MLEAEREPEKLSKKRHLERVKDEKRDTISDVVTSLLTCNIPIFRAQQVKQGVLETADLEVSESFVRHVMRRDLQMGYRLAKQVPIQSNEERCLVLR